jgi:hypothetical protein
MLVVRSIIVGALLHEPDICVTSLRSYLGSVDPLPLRYAIVSFAAPPPE